MARSSPWEMQPMPLAPLECPKVSVLIANFNYEGYVGAAIESVLDQTYTNWELIVCDDGSSDRSIEVIERYVRQDERIRLVRLPENRGMAAATNAAFRRSTGEVVCLLDADDRFYPSKLEKVVHAFACKEGVGFIIHPMTVINGAGQRVQEIPLLTRLESGWLAPRLQARGGRWRDMPTSALCIRRELADWAFPIPEEQFRRAADGFLFTLLPLRTEVASLCEPLSFYRVHSSNDHAQLGLSISRLASDKAFLETQNVAVNTRLEAWLGDGVELRLENHLNYQEKCFLLDVLGDRPRSELLPGYSRLLRALFRDDLYGRLQKVLGFFVFTGALLLPPRLRKTWLDAAFGWTPMKQKLKDFSRFLSADKKLSLKKG